MKRILYGLFICFGFGLALSTSYPSITFAEFGDDALGLVPGIDVIKSDEDPSDSLLDTISNAVNWFLAILATVALVIIIYAGFKMLTSGGDSKGYDAGLKTLKNAAIGLILIGLSWLIVSAIIWFIREQAEGGGSAV